MYFKFIPLWEKCFSERLEIHKMKNEIEFIFQVDLFIPYFNMVFMIKNVKFASYPLIHFVKRYLQCKWIVNQNNIKKCKLI